MTLRDRAAVCLLHAVTGLLAVLLLAVNQTIQSKFEGAIIRHVDVKRGLQIATGGLLETEVTFINLPSFCAAILHADEAGHPLRKIGEIVWCDSFVSTVIKNISLARWNNGFPKSPFLLTKSLCSLRSKFHINRDLGGKSRRFSIVLIEHTTSHLASYYFRFIKYDICLSDAGARTWPNIWSLVLTESTGCIGISSFSGSRALLSRFNSALCLMSSRNHLAPLADSDVGVNRGSDERRPSSNHNPYLKPVLAILVGLSCSLCAFWSVQFGMNYGRWPLWLLLFLVSFVMLAYGVGKLLDIVVYRGQDSASIVTQFLDEDQYFACKMVHI